MIFDIAVIGGGPAGYSAAFEAIRYNLSVVLFERDEIGGTCLNRGCVPTKYLLHTARKYYEAGKDKGIIFETLKLDYGLILKRMSELISSLRSGLDERLKGSGVKLVKGNASLLSAGVIECDGEQYESRYVIIASGTVPSGPLINNSLNSDEILRLDHIPQKLHIVGGGTVAVEFAWIYRMLGSDVSVSIRGERILRGWDKEIAVSLTKSMKKKGIRINTGCDLSDFTAEPDETVLSATGRQCILPRSGSHLFDVDEKGAIVTDQNGQTKTPGIFAAGDVMSGSEKLAHMGMAQGKRTVRFIAGKKDAVYPCAIRCIYTDQEIASAGLTEEEALIRGIDAKTGKQSMFSNARSLISTDERGFVKIIADGSRRTVIGAQLMCEHAGEIIPVLALAVDQSLTVDQMLDTVFPHPSYSETVMEALLSLKDKLDAV